MPGSVWSWSAVAVLRSIGEESVSAAVFGGEPPDGTVAGSTSPATGT